MTGTARLPLHPRPLPHEAASSWIDRLAAAYRLERYELLRSAFGADPPPNSAELDSGRLPGLIAALAGRTGLPLERVRAMTLAGYAPALIGAAEPSPGLFESYAGRFGWFVPPPRRVPPVAASPTDRLRRWTRPESAEPWAPWRSDDLLEAMPRCCPRCLAADVVPYVRLHWRLAWMASCPLHGEMLVPLLALPSLRRFFQEREPNRAAPDLLALDRITLGAVTVGTAVLPRGGAVPGGAWLRALRALIDELVRPVSVIGQWARDELAAAWLRAGSRLDARQGWARIPYEGLPPERRALLLQVAGAAVLRLAVRPAPHAAGTALRACVTQWSREQVCGA